MTKPTEYEGVETKAADPRQPRHGRARLSLRGRADEAAKRAASQRSAPSLLTKIARVLPGLTRREWGEIAIAAARRAGLPEPDVASLRRHLADQEAIDSRA
jgi:hypothetical protein